MADKINVLQYAKLQLLIMALIGLLAGMLYSVGGLIIDIFTIGLNGGTALAFLALIGMPVIFAVFGFITGIIGAFLYNAASKWFGGIELDIKT